MRLYLFLRKLARDRNSHALKTGGKSPKGSSRTSCFPCLPCNVNKNVPVHAGKAKVVPYSSLVSQGWSRATGNENILVTEDPADFTIFKAEVPDELLDTVDLGYLAEYED